MPQVVPLERRHRVEQRAEEDAEPSGQEEAEGEQTDEDLLHRLLSDLGWDRNSWSSFWAAARFRLSAASRIRSTSSGGRLSLFWAARAVASKRFRTM